MYGDFEAESANESTGVPKAGKGGERGAHRIHLLPHLQGENVAHLVPVLGDIPELAVLYVDERGELRNAEAGQQDVAVGVIRSGKSHAGLVPLRPAGELVKVRLDNTARSAPVCVTNKR